MSSTTTTTTTTTTKKNKKEEEERKDFVKVLPEVLKTKITGIMNYSPNKYTIHGTKYEPVATTAYEIRNNTSVIEFGCLPHPIYTELGASPDGITPDCIML